MEYDPKFPWKEDEEEFTEELKEDEDEETEEVEEEEKGE